jgi:hypothetical protein
MLTVFYDHKGVIHHEYTPDGHTVNKEYYVKILHRLRDAVQCSADNLYHGSCTMTMPPPTPPILSRTFWLNIRSHKCCSPPIHHVTSFCSQRRNMLLRRNRFQDTEEINGNEAALGCLLTRVSYLCPVYRHGHCLLIVPD